MKAIGILFDPGRYRRLRSLWRSLWGHWPVIRLRWRHSAAVRHRLHGRKQESLALSDKDN